MLYPWIPWHLSNSSQIPLTWYHLYKPTHSSHTSDLSHLIQLTPLTPLTSPMHHTTCTYKIILLYPLCLTSINPSPDTCQTLWYFSSQASHTSLTSHFSHIPHTSHTSFIHPLIQSYLCYPSYLISLISIPMPFIHSYLFILLLSFYTPKPLYPFSHFTSYTWPLPLASFMPYVFQIPIAYIPHFWLISNSKFYPNTAL